MRPASISIEPVTKLQRGAARSNHGEGAERSDVMRRRHDRRTERCGDGCLKQKVAKKGISPDEFAAEANHIIVDILQYAAEHVLGRVLPATESSGLTPPSSSAHYTHTKPKLARYG